MGGTGFSLKVKTIRGVESKPSELYDELYAIIEDNIRRIAKGKPYTQVTADYLSIAREDGAGYAGTIDFGFRDGAGLCQASVHACNHWFELFVATLAKSKGKGASPLATIAERHGLTLSGRQADIAALLETCPTPLGAARASLRHRPRSKEAVPRERRAR